MTNGGFEHVALKDDSLHSLYIDPKANNSSGSITLYCCQIKCSLKFSYHRTLYCIGNYQSL